MGKFGGRCGLRRI
uniref:Uncharacterized protein n=1 Tax=Arundo donax TaxID=35708 RepID=A0A0A9BKV2_ARUDO